MELETVSTIRLSRSNLICRICGDIARGMNFDVITCMPCKSFFQRNALRSTGTRRCLRKHRCSITKETRAMCPVCRLRKCYALGMNPLLSQAALRDNADYNTFQQLLTTIQKPILLPAPEPLGLLQNDRSTMTSDQWDLLSNIIRSYDEQNLINRVKDLLHQNASLPPKLRLKSADTLNLISQSMTVIQPLIEHSPHFHCLSKNACRALVLHNVFVTGGINGYVTARETDIFNNAMYMTAFSEIYGFDFIENCVRDNERLEKNGSLIKVMLFVLIFSSNCSVVVFNDQEDIETISSSIELIHIQDIYVTMLWKYLVYLYGYGEAVIRFSSLIKSVIDMLRRADEISKNIAYNTLVEKIMTQTERSLTLKD